MFWGIYISVNLALRAWLNSFLPSKTEGQIVPIIQKFLCGWIISTLSFMFFSLRTKTESASKILFILSKTLSITRAISSIITIWPSFIADVIGPSTHSNKLLLLLFVELLFW